MLSVCLIVMDFFSGERTKRSPQFSNLLGVISKGAAIPVPANNPRAGRSGKLRAPYLGPIRHPNPLRRLSGLNPSITSGNFPAANNILSRNLVLPAFGRSYGLGSDSAQWNTNLGKMNGGGFKPSVQLPSTFVKRSHPIATVVPSPPRYHQNNQLPPLLSTSLPNISPTSGLPSQIPLGSSIQVDSNTIYGGRFSNNRPSRSYPTQLVLSTVTGRPSGALNRKPKNNIIFNNQQNLQSNLFLPIGAASGLNKNANNAFSNNFIIDGNKATINSKNLDSKFKSFKAVNFFDQSKPSSDIVIPITNPTNQSPINTYKPSQSSLLDEKQAITEKLQELFQISDPTIKSSNEKLQELFQITDPTIKSPKNIAKSSRRSLVEGKQAITFVDDLDATPSSPSLITELPSQVSTPRMFTEILGILSDSTSRPAAFNGKTFIKEIGRYPDVFATSSPAPAQSPFPLQNNNQQLITSNPTPKPVFQNSNSPPTTTDIQSIQSIDMNSINFQNNLDSSSASGPNPTSLNNNNNVPNTRFPVEAFRNVAAVSGRPLAEKEPLSEDLLNLVNSLRGRLQPKGNKQQPRRPKNNNLSGGRGNGKKNKSKKKGSRKQKSKKSSRLGKKQQNKLGNAIRLISSSSLDGRLGRQAQQFGPNAAGPVVEGFPAGLPAATPEGVKIALSSPLGKIIEKVLLIGIYNVL